MIRAIRRQIVGVVLIVAFVPACIGDAQAAPLSGRRGHRPTGFQGCFHRHWD
jgi:hypothetical protein